MPHILSEGPFLALRHDDSCGRSQTNGLSSPKLNGSGKPLESIKESTINDIAGNLTNGDQKGISDEFLRLSKPQQDVLLLHGPGKRYSLERSQDIPDLHDDREILVQSLAIGLNPVDWKGADYGFALPSLPWINGRDFAGIVVRAPRAPSRIKIGDIVCGPSTDYRDVRKAAYQEYIVTTDYNVARVTAGITVKAAAAIGVAFVAAAITLGVSFGLDFGRIDEQSGGPDLYELIRAVDKKLVADDVKAECFDNVPQTERAKPGDWLAIWGASSTTAMMALQLAKRAGLRVICVADVAKYGERLVELGADVMVDRVDTERAIKVIRGVTGNRLRFAFDTVGKESATQLQAALAGEINGQQSHLLGLSGLPSTGKQGVVAHAVPIKVFHDVPIIGETIMTWLEELMLNNTLSMPQIEIAQGGLAGINNALDQLRSGTVSGKRIVVPVGESHESNGSGVPAQPSLRDLDDTDEHLRYHDQLNSQPDRLKFAYWVPNVSGGLVISKIPQNTDWTYKANKRYGRVAERVGFEYALTQIRFMAGYGAENQHESVSFSQAILHATRRLKVIAAVLPGPWNPTVAAKQLASIDNYSDGRICVNVVFGWFKAEFTSIGQWWLDHAERYRRGREFIQCLKGIWTQESFNFHGDFYQYHNYPLKPKPLSLPGRPWPEIFQGGNSLDARENAAHVSDYYFMNGNTLEGFQSQIADVKERAVKAGREGEVHFAVNAFVIVRDTEEEAIETLQEIQGKADKDAVNAFRDQVQNAGASSKEKSGMWANSKFEDLVQVSDTFKTPTALILPLCRHWLVEDYANIGSLSQYNDGFKTKLIGTADQVVERILMLKSLGISILLCAFLHYDSEIEAFGQKVLNRVRELEKQGRGKDQVMEIRRTGDVYREKKQTNGA
ncbi:MAG: hypothetical protein M1828_005182 [Chrysothrix sp. TS-e1954]|nr:MAG: hypothetical protein M1828_005182 [Chrysothrix sp. TS-e1954]